MSQFDKAAAAIKKSAEFNAKMTDDELLQIYALFKQGKEGDCNAPEPKALIQAMSKDHKKWSAWNSKKGVSKEQAQTEYVTLAKTLLNKYGLSNLIDF